MSLRHKYVNAIEQRLRWLKWAKSPSGQRSWNEAGFGAAMPQHIEVLERADAPTFYVEDQFAELIDHARQSIPDDIAFEHAWLLAPAGFLWLDTPFDVPYIQMQEGQPERLTLKVLRAIGWLPVPRGALIARQDERDTITAESDSVQILTFQDFSLLNPSVTGFGCWSYFLLQDHERLGDRITKFERKARREDAPGSYIEDRRSDLFHEIRWVYAALHLMSQRLSVTVQHTVDRATRRRVEREHHTIPPLIRVITLRRLQQDREHAGREGRSVDWQWQWSVSGHWRNQFYPTEGVHKRIFVESYLKGPADKPLKPGALKLYTARR